MLSGMERRKRLQTGPNFGRLDKTDLHRFVAVAIGVPSLHHDARTDNEDGARDSIARLTEDLGHADFAT